MANINDQDLRDRTTINRNTTGQDNLADGLVRREVGYDQTAYRDGYWQGRNSERRSMENLRSRENESVASGLILGVLLTGLFGLGASIYFFLLNLNHSSQTAPVINIPAPSQSPQAPERVIERVVPVPQNLPDVKIPTPNVNVTVPNLAPSSPTTQPQDNVTQETPKAEEASPAPANTPQ